MICKIDGWIWDGAYNHKLIKAIKYYGIHINLKDRNQFMPKISNNRFYYYLKSTRKRTIWEKVKDRFGYYE